jgi:hypothetical protein
METKYGKATGMRSPFTERHVTWKVIIRRTAGFLVLLFFLNFVFLVVELLTNRHFSVLPFQEYSMGWRIGLTLFWFTFWLMIYRTLGGSLQKKRK